MSRRAAKRKDRKNRDASEAIPVASFSDIAFLLIIFFIVTTTLIQTKGFETELPAGQESEETDDETATVTITLDRILLNEKVVTMRELQTALLDLELFDPDKTETDRMVVLKAQGEVPYQQYYQAMVLIQRAGGILAIVREEKEGGGQ